MKVLKHLFAAAALFGAVSAFAQGETPANETKAAVPAESQEIQAPVVQVESQEIQAPVVQVESQEIQAPVVPAESSASSGSNRGIEKIEVTGSHIKRIDVEGPSPVLTLDREYLDRSGYNSVADVLRDSTITATGVVREQAGSGTSGSATAGLRGFGPDKILVLLDGMRLPKIGGENSVDLNLIPFQAIERVEILKDGASAIYGSDALAGVINFVTRKDFDGASFSSRYSYAEEAGGNRQDIAAVYGKNTSKGNILAIYQYRNNQGVRDKDRDWSTPGRSTLGSPGSYRAVGAPWQPDPACPPGQFLPSGTSTFCSFDFSPFSWQQPDIEQHSGVLSGAYDINESLGLYGTATYTARQARWQYAPAPDIFADDTATGGGNFQVPNATNSLPGWGLPGIGANDFELRYRLVEELGPRASRDETDSYGGTVGARGYLSDTWEWDQSVTYGTSGVYNRGHGGYADKNKLFAALNDGSWTPFNPGNKGSVAQALHVSEQWIDSSLVMTQFKVNGEIANIADGILSAAAGISAAWEDFEERVDSVTQEGALFGGAGASGQASRSYQALFTELGYTISDFEFQLAGRFDRFSDFGETVNPKFGIRYRPADAIMFRGSVGTGFKAPTLTELYSSQGYGYPEFTDITGCAASPDPENDPVCDPQQFKTLTGGNADLKEETSFSYNVGTVIQPNKNFNITVDYWYTVIDGAIGLDLDDLMLAEQALGTGIQTYGVQVLRDSNGAITEVVAPNLNLAKQQADGLEFSAQYSMNFGSFKVTPSVNHTHLLSFLEEPFPGLGLISKLGEAGRPRWRNTSFVTVGFGSHSVRAGARTVAGQFKKAHTADRSDQRKLADYTEFDLNYVFKGSWGGSINFGIKNVAGTDRPIDDTAGFQERLNGALYDQIGRLFYLGYNHDF